MRRVFRLFGRRQVIREVEDELAFHLEMRTRKLMDQGLPADDARREAERQFGNVDAVRQSCVTMDQERERAMRRADLLDQGRQDLVYAFRTLGRNPGFAAVVVLTLALGIGANTAIFTLVNAVMLRTLPVQDPGALVGIGHPARIGSLSQGSPRADLISYPLYQDLVRRNDLVSGLLATGRTPRLDVRIDSQSAGAGAEHPRGRFVSGNYFSVLGVGPAAGRLFDGTEDAAIGAAPVVVISHAYWTRRFGGAASALGRAISINGAAFTIIGVSAPGFDGEIVGRLNDVFIPATMQPVVQPHQRMLDDRLSSWLLLIGRLKRGVTIDQARAAFTTQITDVIRENTPGGPALADAAVQGLSFFIEPGGRGFSSVRSSFRAPLVTLVIGVGLLLLIICGNVANLLLARAVTRSREISVRLALGANRARLVRQLVTESMLLAAMGSGAGLAVAWWGSRLLLKLAADGGSVIPLNLSLDVPVLAFTGGLAVLAVGLFGLMPALRASRVDLATTMRAHARSVEGFGGRGQRAPLGKVLISSQVALSIVLLVGAALLVRSLQSVQNADAGLDREHLLIVESDADDRGYTDARLYAFAEELGGRFARLPGVRAATWSENGIFSGTESANTFQVPGFQATTSTDSVANSDQVGPGYFATIGARVLEGREFGDADRSGSTPVIVVNRTMAMFYWPDRSPIGAFLRFDSVTTAQVVGVVADVKDHDLTAAPQRRFYVPYEQPSVGGSGGLKFILRTTGDPAALVDAVRQEMRAMDPVMRTDEIVPLPALMRESIREERLMARLASGFGLLALALAAIGLYGVMTYAINRRTGEIGLRVALGASRGSVVRMVLGDALGLVGLGLVIGLPLAIGATRLLKQQLHGVSSVDPVAIGSALMVLVVSAAIAALLPALRASRVPPMVALRQD